MKDYSENKEQAASSGEGPTEDIPEEAKITPADFGKISEFILNVK